MLTKTRLYMYKVLIQVSFTGKSPVARKLAFQTVNAFIFRRNNMCLIALKRMSWRVTVAQQYLRDVLQNR